MNDLTSAGSKKYVSYIPDIILRIYETYPTADIKNLQCELQEYTVKDLLTDAISKYEKFPEKKKTVKTMKELNILSKGLQFRMIRLNPYYNIRQILQMQLQSLIYWILTILTKSFIIH